MRVSRHIFFSLPLAVIGGFFTKSIHWSIVYLTTSVLLDVDHIFDYAYLYGLNRKCFFKLLAASEENSASKKKHNFTKIYVLLHSFELVSIAWILAIFTKNSYLYAFAFGYSTHLFLDYIGNHEYYKFYFLIWRIRNKFSVIKISPKNQ
jgi:hypothetical protein